MLKTDEPTRGYCGQGMGDPVLTDLLILASGQKLVKNKILPLNVYNTQFIKSEIEFDLQLFEHFTALWRKLYKRQHTIQQE